MGNHIRDYEQIFEDANTSFLKKNKMLFEAQVSERTLCGALMIEIYERLKNTNYFQYFVDVEYNRNYDGRIKTMKQKMDDESDEKIVKINCDIIVHGRGENVNPENLIAIEMKKSTAKRGDRDNDRSRLEGLTKELEKGVWLYGGGKYPKHVCGYGLGVYYEINFKKKNILVEYYRNGSCYHKYLIKWNKLFQYEVCSLYTKCQSK